jgi:signal transduction histidine kinase
MAVYKTYKQAQKKLKVSISDPAKEQEYLHNISEISQIVSEPKTSQSLFETVKARFAKLVSADRVEIFLLDSETDQILSYTPDAAPKKAYPISTGIVGAVIESAITKNVSNIKDTDPVLGDIDRIEGYSINNLLCVPIKNRTGKTLGAVELYNKPGNFTEQDEGILEILCTNVAINLEKIIEFENIKEKNRQIILLNQIQTQSVMVTSFEEIIKIILKKTLVYLKASKAIMVLPRRSQNPNIYRHILSQKGEQFTISTPLHDPFSPTQTDPTGEFNKVRVKTPAYTEKLKNAELFETHESIAARLKSEDSFIGFLEIFNDEDRSRFFNPQEIDFVKTLTNVAANILQRKLREDEQKKGEKLAIIGKMVASIVHDIRNPLSGISGFAKIVQSRTKDEKIRNLTEIMITELSRLEEMNNEILSYVRGKELLLKPDQYSTTELLQELAQVIEPEFQRLNINVEIIDEYGGSVYIDKNKMMRVFMNICNNARDSIKIDGIFKIFCKKVDKNIIFEFEDNGKGMPSYIKETVFEPFVSYGKTHGTGLGMAIAKNIVKAHKGTIEFESTLDLGTIFIISLPGFA